MTFINTILIQYQGVFLKYQGVFLKFQQRGEGAFEIDTAIGGGVYVKHTQHGTI